MTNEQLQAEIERRHAYVALLPEHAAGVYLRNLLLLSTERLQEIADRPDSD